MNVFDYEIDSVSKYLAIIDGQCYNGRWMFRGHSDFKWELKPGIGRLFGNPPFLERDNLLEWEKKSFKEFVIQSHSELRHNNDFILLAVAQHHGLKTRLLDWSFSALVALFFAVEDSSQYDKNGAILAFHWPHEFNNHTSKKDSNPFNLSDIFDFIFSPSLSPRIRAQKGVFQLFRDPTTAFSEGYNLCKYQIPALKKVPIKQELERLGVTYHTLYPDLDGLCKELNYTKLQV